MCNGTQVCTNPWRYSGILALAAVLWFDHVALVRYV